MPALIAGTLDAARLEIVDWLNLQDKAPDKFHILIDFGKVYPQIRFSAFSVSKTWAAQHPVAVHDFIRALLLAQRDIIANPQLLRDNISKYLGVDSARAQKLADAYLALNVWDANGRTLQGRCPIHA